METVVETGDIDPRELAQLEDTDRQKRQAARAAIDTSIQKGAWGKFGSPAGGPSIAQQPAPVDPFQQQVQREMLDQVEARKRAGQAQIAAMEERARITGDKSAQLGKEIEEAPQIPMPNVPKPPPIPTREQSIDPTAAKSLFAVASVIGALGMMGGRGRGMLAMSGMTGMIEGFREGNTEKYKAAKDQYDRAVDEQLNTYRMEYQQYLAKVQNQKDTWAQRILAINLQARAAGDKAMIAATEAGNADAVFGQLMDFEKVIATLDKARQTSELFSERKALLDAQTQHALASARAADARAAQVGKEHPDDNKLGPAGKYFDKEEGDFIPQRPTIGELRANPQRYARLSEQQASALTFLQNAKLQIPKLRSLANRVLSENPIGSAVTGLSGIGAEMFREGSPMAQFKQITNTLKNEANRLETGGNRALQGMAQQVAEQLPTTHSNKTVALDHLTTFEGMVNDRIKTIVGKGYDPVESEGGEGAAVGAGGAAAGISKGAPKILKIERLP